MAQFGRALRSGRRGRKFKSCHSDFLFGNQGFLTLDFFYFKAQKSTQNPPKRERKMSDFELILIAIGLSMDAFAVSVCKGLSTKNLKTWQMFVTGAWFGIFQALMPLIGYFLGTTFESYITSVDHWVAFVLLSFLGAKMLKEGFGHNSCSNFVDKYGVTEISEESVIRPATYKYNEEGERVPDKYRVMRQVSFKKKPVAGVSPMIFANYLMNNTVFLKQEDITKELVPYNEIPVGIDMDDELKNRYEEITNIIRTRAIEGTISTNNTSRTAIKGMITYLDMMLEQPFGLDDIVNMDGRVVIESKELDSKKIRNKEQYLIDLCKRKKEAKEKILIYVHWTGKTCIQERLKKILGDNEIKAEIMTDKIKMADRQEWVNNKSKDVDAIIVNPRLVDVGLNLLPYTTIVFYEIGNQLSVIRQSSKRSWRINQTHPVEVYFMYYKNTVQEQLLGAISQKLKAATAIEGNFSAEGLSSVSSDTDMMNMIASSIVNNESIEIENDGFESIGSMSAGEARKLRAESCIKLGLREGFEYGTVNMMYGSNNTKTKKRSAKQNKTTIDLYDTLSAVI